MEEDFDSENSFDDEVKWEYLKFKIQNLKISYFKIHAQNNKKIKNDIENKLKDLKNDLNNYDKLQKYSKIKLEEIYGKFIKSASIRGKCTWYKKGEKSTKLFLNSVKKRSSRANSKTHYWLQRNYGSK